MKRLVAIAASALSVSAHAQVETQITVLGVMLPGASYSRAVTFLNDVADPVYWINNGVGVTVRLANFGVPVDMPAPRLSTGSGPLDTQFANATVDARTHKLRKDADVIIYFTGVASNLQECGWAPQFFWASPGTQPRWRPSGPDNLDLRGDDDWFQAIVVTGGPLCAVASDTAIHELGHLLGAGHEVPPAVSGSYLFSDSHAGFFSVYGFQGRSIVTQDTTRPFFAMWTAPWPYNIWQITPNAYNKKAVQTTGKSVANYRTTEDPPLPPPPNPPPQPLPPGCTLQGPINPVAVYVPPACNPYPASRYNFYWDDMCPGVVSHYRVEDQQPAGTGPWVLTDTTLWRGLAVGINGAPGRLRVKACSGAVCSVPSSTVLITDQC
jgi:hypothetical protein